MARCAKGEAYQRAGDEKEGVRREHPLTQVSMGNHSVNIRRTAPLERGGGARGIADEHEKEGTGRGPSPYANQY